MHWRTQLSPQLSHKINVNPCQCRQELDHGGWRLSPVAQRLRNLLHSDAADGAQARPAGAPPAAAIVQPGGSALPPPRGNMI